MKVEPYLIFAGRCDEALAFYREALDAQTTMLMRFSESPDPPPMPLPEGWGDKVMHSAFFVGDTRVMASDGMSAEPADFSGVMLSITADAEAQARHRFAALADGGHVLMPIGPTFFSPCFGMCADRFGVRWMVGVEAPAA